MRSMLRALVLILCALSLSGCWLVYEPCDDLEKRLCADLGDDCEILQTDRQIREDFIPRLRRKSELNKCAMLVDDHNYAVFTLPFARFRTQSKRGVVAPMPNLPRISPVNTPYSFSSPYLSFLPIVFIAGVLFVSWRSWRKIKKSTSASAAGVPTVGSPWAQVDTMAKAHEHLRFGTLIQAELYPAVLGPAPVPHNSVLLPPAAAAQKSALEQQILGLLRQGTHGQLVVVPHYRGPSLVPASVVLYFGGQTQSITVW